MNSSVKISLLAFAILLGFVLKANTAHARDIQVATVAGGCFWCVERDFESVRGVTEVVSGYTGGHKKFPTYDQVARGRTGHMEAVQITFDADVVSLDQIYHLYFRSVDPTDPGGQFCDRGSAYGTAIFVDGPEQRAAADRAKRDARRDLGKPIVTKIEDLGPFWPAEAEHQDYAKGRKIVLTRRGLKRQRDAYEFYRRACGRDRRVEALWGDEAPFVRH